MDIGRWSTTLDRWLDGSLTPDELHQWQSASLRAVIDHVQRRSRFYADRLAWARPSTLTLDNLATLPFTTQDDVSDAMFDMLCGPVSDAHFYFETTENAERPTPCPKAEIDFDLDYRTVAHALRGMADHHFTDGEKPILAVAVPNELHPTCNTIAYAAKHAGITRLDIFPRSPAVGFDRFFQVLLDLRVNMLVGSPSTLMGLAELSQRYGVDVRQDLDIRCLLATGGSCSDGTRALLGRAWDSTVYNFLYGPPEVGAVAVATATGALAAVTPNYVFEVIDPDTEESLGFQGTGELCLTTLIPGIKPLIRYRTGDLVTIVRDSRSDRMVIDVLGPVSTRVCIGGRQRTAAEIENAVLVDAERVSGYVLDIVTRNDRDHLEIRVSAHGALDDEQLKGKVRDRVLDALGVGAEVNIISAPGLADTTGGEHESIWGGWKSGRIQDLRTPKSDKNVATRHRLWPCRWPAGAT
jgi:phenylacetate-CoA ligase